MNIRTQRLAVWTGPLLCLLFAVGLIGLAQFIPPPRADASLADVARIYSERTNRLRAGLVLMMLGAGFLASWGGAITTQLKRIEGAHSPMTWTNLACTGANVMVVTVPVMIMIAASFRPDRNPEITQALNDLAWIMFVMVFPPVMVQELSIAAAVFSHEGQKVYPRWVGYFNVW
jgi:drug/metabolite transporter (DMT)-like permease